MINLSEGEYFGQQDKKSTRDGITMTCTTYTHERVDWHRHENAYFTFLLTGKMAEINRQGSHYCSPGTLLFHNSEEAHYNTKPKDYTRGFHLELSQAWFLRHGLRMEQGSFPVADPRKKLIVFELFREFLHAEKEQTVAVDFLVNALAQGLDPDSLKREYGAPKWVPIVREAINDLPGKNWKLTELSGLAGVHPNHLCRAFTRYFGCSLGRYLRAVRLQRAVILMVNSDLSLSEIGYTCGFADQSHFIRVFRNHYKLTPLAYRKQIASPPG